MKQQHYLDLVYLQAVQRNRFNAFIGVLEAPVCIQSMSEKSDCNAGSLPENPIRLECAIIGVGERARQQKMLQESEINLKTCLEEFNANANISSTAIEGCGLKFLSSKIREHYQDEGKRYNKLPVRLIGKQAIALARYSYRLVDTLVCKDESEAQVAKRLALGKAGEYLRNAGEIFNQTSVNSVLLHELKEACEIYFNLLSLFFPDSVNVTVWTIGYAIPYHAKLLFEKYGIGYGIVSLQAKEAKHAGIKQDLAHTNRSNATNACGKWWQVMRQNYVQSFYLPEHHPMPSLYSSHFQSRSPPHTKLSDMCKCGRQKVNDEIYCDNCLLSNDVVTCAKEKKLTDTVLCALKPVVCNICDSRFADSKTLLSHQKCHHVNGVNSVHINPRDMTVHSLKEALKIRGLSTDELI